MSTEFTKWYYDTCIHMSNMKMLKIGSAVLQKELKMFKFWCTWMDGNNVPRIPSPYFGIRNGAWFKLFFFSSSKRISNISRERKNIVNAFENRNIFWLRHIFVDIYNEEWFEKKISHNSKTGYLQGWTPVLYRSAGFKAFKKEYLIIMLQLYIFMLLILKQVWGAVILKHHLHLLHLTTSSYTYVCNDK